MLFVKISYNGHQQLRFTRTNMGLGGPEEDHQLHHCCWTGRVGDCKYHMSIFELSYVAQGPLNCFVRNSRQVQCYILSLYEKGMLARNLAEMIMIGIN